MKNIFLKIVFVCACIMIPCSSFAQEAGDDIGEQIFRKKCSGCHGRDGKTQAFGISRKLAEMPSSEIKDRLTLFYNDKNLQSSGGVSGVMSKQTSALNKQQFDGVLSYVQKNFASDKASR
ncbi:MAG: c-type cytochrome [Campylobacteraceae bacterium]|jgi:mono/diheme cytochrome c family protein|nr:c-type cytochrome [Campylobacteraceae bacterium]